jgi:hypothetical protein
MRDLTIHGDDLVIGTHGRSFWILDDLTPLRQLSEQIAKSGVFLFVPQEALRWHWNRNPDTPLPPEVPGGANPPDGAIIDYYLASNAQGPVTLEILDPKGELVRRYSSSDKPPSIEKIAAEHPIPMYWVRPTQILSRDAGMHRFVWNVRYSQPKALEYEFPISAIVHNTPLSPLGPWALPGSYTVKLTVNGQTYTQPLSVKMDPRIQTPLDDLRKQHEMEMGAAEGMDESYEALEQVKSVREQIKQVSSKANGKEHLSKDLDALDQQCADLEGATQRSFYGVPSSGKQPENLSTLNQHFSAVLGVAQSADAAPTTQATAAYKDLEDSETALRKGWSALREREILDVNKELKAASLPAIDPKKPLDEELGGASEGDDEP